MSLLAAVVTALGLAITALAALGANALYNRTENRLLELRVKDAGSAVTSELPSVQTPLASAVALAEATEGSVAKFKSFAGSYAGPSGEFASMSLWSLGPGSPALLSSVGAAPLLAGMPTLVRRYIGQAPQGGTLNVAPLFGFSTPVIGYTFATATYAVYAETILPDDRRGEIAKTSPFAGFNFALYVGKSESSADLIETNLDHLPVGGRHYGINIPFGNSSFALVMSPKGSLSGGLDEESPWIALGIGILITVAASLTTERLIRQRSQAEDLARANRDLYAAQHDIAVTLQQAMLPAALPDVPGTEIFASYQPGVEGIEVGGDWYDVFVPREGTALLMIGDVVGRGLRSAVVMSSLRHTARAYAAQGDPPEVILDRLSSLIRSEHEGYFATVLCAEVDVEGRKVRVASAGHLPPLILTSTGSRYLPVDSQPPLGVGVAKGYTIATFDIPTGATLLAYTDGLIERRGTSLDEGMEKLRQAAEGPSASLSELIGRLIEMLISGHPDDDAAILGLRWTH